MRREQSGPTKRYDAAATYERKLARVMERLGVEKFNWDHSRHGAWVEFWYRGQLYRFHHTVERARAAGINLHFGSDCFAQIVLSLEDLARMVERGIYELGIWVAGMKALPAAPELPDCLRWLNFAEKPSVEELRARYRELCKTMHPDVGGSNEDFKKLRNAYEQACAFLGVRA